MSTLLPLRSLPVNETGLVLSTLNTPSWTLGTWKEISVNIPCDIFICAVSFSVGFVLGSASITYEFLVEVGLGEPGSANPVIQIPWSLRAGTLVGFYNINPTPWFLPEPYFVPQGSTICLRCSGTHSSSGPTWPGVRIFYQGNNALLYHPTNSINFENYKQVSGGNGISVSEKLR